MKPVPLPAPDATKGDLATALDGQTARLDLANGHTADLAALIDRCIVRQDAVLKALQPPPPAWEFWRR